MAQSRSKTAVKSLSRLRNTRAGWAPTELAKLLRSYGFTTEKQARHGLFLEHPSYAEWATVIIPRHRECEKWVAQDALAKIEQVVALEDDDSDDTALKEDDSNG